MLQPGLLNLVLLCFRSIRSVINMHLERSVAVTINSIPAILSTQLTHLAMPIGKPSLAFQRLRMVTLAYSGQLPSL
jgi:hypothetical protein